MLVTFLNIYRYLTEMRDNQMLETMAIASDRNYNCIFWVEIVGLFLVEISCGFRLKSGIYYHVEIKDMALGRNHWYVTG